jgi:4,5-DOPA dioxygenase extradiol
LGRRLDQLFADRLELRDLKPLADREGPGTLLQTAHPTADHCRALGLRDKLTVMTDAIDLGSVSMRSFVFHA